MKALVFHGFVIVPLIHKTDCAFFQLAFFTQDETYCIGGILIFT